RCDMQYYARRKPISCTAPPPPPQASSACTPALQGGAAPTSEGSLPGSRHEQPQQDQARGGGKYALRALPRRALPTRAPKAGRELLPKKRTILGDLERNCSECSAWPHTPTPANSPPPRTPPPDSTSGTWSAWDLSTRGWGEVQSELRAETPPPGQGLGQAGIAEQRSPGPAEGCGTTPSPLSRAENRSMLVRAWDPLRQETGRQEGLELRRYVRELARLPPAPAAPPLSVRSLPARQRSPDRGCYRCAQGHSADRDDPQTLPTTDVAGTARGEQNPSGAQAIPSPASPEIAAESVARGIVLVAIAYSDLCAHQDDAEESGAGGSDGAREIVGLPLRDEEGYAAQKNGDEEIAAAETDAAGNARTPDLAVRRGGSTRPYQGPTSTPARWAAGPPEEAGTAHAQSGDRAHSQRDARGDVYEDQQAPAPADLFADIANWDLCPLRDSRQPPLARLPPRPLRESFAICLLTPLLHLAKNPDSSSGWKLLLFLPRILLRSSSARKPDWRGMGDSLTRFRQGLWRNLYNEAADAVANSPQPRHVPDTTGKLARAEGLAKRGNRAKSLQTLTATPVCTPSAEVLDALMVRHPEASRAIPDWVHDFASENVPSITARDFRRLLAKCPNGVGAEPSGATFEHLRDATLGNADVLAQLHALTNTALAGKLSAEAADLLTASQLLAFSKPQGGTRPIAVGECLLHLIAKAPPFLAAPAAREHFTPLQFGVAIAGGIEAAIHSTRTYLEEFPGATALQIDLANACNAVERAAVFEGLKGTALDPLVPLVRLSYSRPYALYLDHDFGAEPLQSTRGVRQGDPLGPLLFADSIHTCLVATPAAHPEVVLLAYADDITLLFEAANCTAAFAHLTEALLAHGLSHNPAKCEAWSAVALDPATLPPGINISPDEALPLGEWSAWGEGLLHTYLAAAHTKIPRDRAKRDRIWQQAALPASLGGLGITNPAVEGGFAYLASVVSAAHLLRSFGDSANPALTGLLPLMDADEESTSLLPRRLAALEAELSPDGTEALQAGRQKPNGPRLQQALSLAVHTAVYIGLQDSSWSMEPNPLSGHTQRLQSLLGPGAGDWLHAVPLIPSLRLGPSQFSSAASFRLGLPLPVPRRCNCRYRTTFPDDRLPNHLMRCEKGGGRIATHHALRDECAKIAAEAGFTVHKETTAYSPVDNLKADISVRHPDTGEVWICDITVTDPVSYQDEQARKAPGWAARMQVDKKQSKYTGRSAWVGFYAMAVETYGYPSPGVLDFIRSCAELAGKRRFNAAPKSREVAKLLTEYRQRWSVMRRGGGGSHAASPSY
ncbi:unnamed protein product, partial [Closterium sp. NIES-53]